MRACDALVLRTVGKKKLTESAAWLMLEGGNGRRNT
jgi:hypothetical protein